MEKCCAYRDFEIYDENQKKLAMATTKWVLLDAETRKIKRIQENLTNEYKSEPERSVFEEEISKLREAENEEISIKSGQSLIATAPLVT